MVLSGLIALAAILGAWGFELIGGLEPCPLCLTQRTPYYAGLPILAAGLLAASADVSWNGLAARLAVLAFIAAMLIGAGIGVYHAGVEWGWWAGPGACSVAGTQGPATVGELIEQLDDAEVVRCDEAPIRVLGLSLAGWNVIVSLVVAGLAARGFRRMV